MGLTTILIISMFFLSLFNPFVPRVNMNDIKENSQFIIVTNNENIRVAIIDSGISSELKINSNIIKTYNAFDGSSNVVDEYGHGTAIVCIIACADESLDVYGLSKEVDLIIVKAFDNNGNTSEDAILDALDYLQSQNVDIVNMSFGSYLNNHEVEKKLLDLSNSGVVIVSSSGDDIQGRGVSFPASLEFVTSVSSNMLFVKDYKIDIVIVNDKYKTITLQDGKLVSLELNGSSYSAATYTAYLVNKYYYEEKENKK
jgi:subtilisin family serine protease